MKSNFSQLPSVSISRSKFIRKSNTKTSFKLGELVPIYLDEVLPGDTRKIDIGSLIRMSTPVAPIMDNIYLDVYAFFVPNRLTWSHWKEFMGENTTGAGIYSGLAYYMPTISAVGITSGRLGDYFGLPVGLEGSDTKVSALPVRGYRLIYNRFFRDQNVIAPLTVPLTDNTNSSYDTYNQYLQKVAKVSDYFTRSLPYAQKGAAVKIPLGTSAPIIASGTTLHTMGEIRLGGAGEDGDPIQFGSKGVLAATSVGKMQHFAGSSASNEDVPQDVKSSNLYADLTTATAATINALRFAFQYQKMLEKDALYGTRYWEIIKAHFGVTAPDASLQDPELLGHRKIYITVDQVVQTTGINQSTPASNELGSTAAVSVTADGGNLFSKSFCEHGYIHIYVCARHDQTYGQGIDRMWSRTHREDYYFPVFANLGAQEVRRKEIYATGSTANDMTVFGYQEAWAEYRYKRSICTNLLNPSVSGSLGYWTLTNNFAAAPTLGQTFIEQDRNAISRVLQTGSTGPDFVADFAFRDTAVRPMPLYSIPGLIDHH